MLAVIGGRYVSGDNTSNTTLGKTLLRASIFVFIGLSITILVLSAISLPKVRHYRAERVVIITLFATVPFIMVRLAYSILTVFADQTADSIFNPTGSVDRSVWVHFVMVVAMEMIVVILAELSSMASSRTRGLKGEVHRESRGPSGF